jgi:hypothetical protein
VLSGLSSATSALSFINLETDRRLSARSGRQGTGCFAPTIGEKSNLPSRVERRSTEIQCRLTFFGQCGEAMSYGLHHTITSASLDEALLGLDAK